MRCDKDELRTLFLFEKLTDEQLDWLCEQGRVEQHDDGWLCREGDPATCFFVLIEGEVTIEQRSRDQDVEISRTSDRGAYGGAFQAYLGDRVQQTYSFSMRVLTPSRFFVLDADKFAWFVQEWFPMAVHLLEGLFFGNRNRQRAMGQRDRLLALGSLSAGLTHELNNPAGAAVRATAALRERVAGMRHKLAMIAAGKWDPQMLKRLIGLQEEAVERVAKAPELSPLETSDAEDRLADWLEDHDVSGGWELAPTFVQAGLDEGFLDRVVEAAGDESQIEGAVRWINYTVETEMLMDEIQDSTNRISNLVGAAKQYSQMDRAPFQVVDVHVLLKSTLVMLTRKIGEVQIVKDFDRSLPKIPAYAAELNQVWTNLIDNAVSAMDGSGTLTVRTARDGDRLLVEIGDTGPGVPEDIQDRIFEPFFTTKAVGEGTGLGLDISYRIVVDKHHGDLRVESKPGDTRFQVRLPFESSPADPPPEEAPEPAEIS